MVKLERTRVNSNYAISQGGGIYLWNAAVEADAASTVSFNHAGDGGGVSLVGAFSDFNNSETGSENGAVSVNFTGVYGNMASASGTPDVSARYRVGVWYDVCKTSNRYTQSAYSNLTMSTINYCPTGACYSPYDSSGCPAYTEVGVVSKQVDPSVDPRD